MIETSITVCAAEKKLVESSETGQSSLIWLLLSLWKEISPHLKECANWIWVKIKTRCSDEEFTWMRGVPSAKERWLLSWLATEQSLLRRPGKMEKIFGEMFSLKPSKSPSPSISQMGEKFISAIKMCAELFSFRLMEKK